MLGFSVAMHFSSPERSVDDQIYKHKIKIVLQTDKWTDGQIGGHIMLPLRVYNAWHATAGAARNYKLCE